MSESQVEDKNPETTDKPEEHELSELEKLQAKVEQRRIELEQLRTQRSNEQLLAVQDQESARLHGELADIERDIASEKDMLKRQQAASQQMKDQVKAAEERRAQAEEDQKKAQEERQKAAEQTQAAAQEDRRARAVSEQEALRAQRQAEAEAARQARRAANNPGGTGPSDPTPPPTPQPEAESGPNANNEGGAE